MCDTLFGKYPDFDPGLRGWFDSKRETFFDLHISCAGRGRVEQNALFARGATKAHYTKSAHNYNAALDLWQNVLGAYVLDPEYFAKVMADLDPAYEWYGAPGSEFFELPHIQLSTWKRRVADGSLTLVEP